FLRQPRAVGVHAPDLALDFALIAFAIETHVERVVETGERLSQFLDRRPDCVPVRHEAFTGMRQKSRIAVANADPPCSKSIQLRPVPSTAWFPAGKLRCGRPPPSSAARRAARPRSPALRHRGRPRSGRIR